MVATPAGVLVDENEPQPGEQLFPPSVRLQFTPFSATSLFTVAMKLNVWLGYTFSNDGDTDTVIGCTTIVADPTSLLSAADVAVSVTVIADAGAV